MEINKMAITKEQVLENLQNLIGEEWSADDVICCFEGCYGDEPVNVWQSAPINTGYDYIAYAGIHMEDSEQFLITVNEDGTMKDVWIA